VYKSFIKRIVDIVLSSILLILSSPLFLLVFLLLLISNKGNVFFRQPRPGKNEKLFNVIKFKTMNDTKGENGELLPDKDRLTPVGNFVRKTSLDEIPQLYNILKGDMSLIGPRPWLVEYLPLYNDYQRRRHEVRPGITGWAQVNGRNLLGWEDRFKHDVYYVDHLSFWLDIKIIFMTVWNIFAAKGISGDGHVTMEKFTMEKFGGNKGDVKLDGGLVPPLGGQGAAQGSSNATLRSPKGEAHHTDTDMHHDASPIIFKNAQTLRESATQTEQILWARIRNKQLGVKFRRQHPLKDYVLDFYCHQRRLAIELDGEYHSDAMQQKYDQSRDQDLLELDIKTIRFSNDQILNNLDTVLEAIKSELAGRVPPSESPGCNDLESEGHGTT
jgi:lipopolysaccharide/colanic/teichoic acid biosynthesis glycosyltransferase/very-short-patch-repair endonuclease